MRKKRVVLHVLKYEKNAAKEGKTLLKLNYEKKKKCRTCTTKSYMYDSREDID